MTTTRQDTKFHHCELTRESDDIVKIFIESGMFVELRRKVKRCLMISAQHPLARFYVNSTRMLRREEKRHLINHYYMIHPLSIFNFWFKCLVSLTLYTEYFFWPIIAPYCSPEFLQYTFAIHNVAYFLLIILSFVVGRYDRKRNIVILNFRKVVLRYLTTLFIFDIVAISPVILRIELTIHTEWNINWRIIRILRWTLPLFKYARYMYFIDAYKEVKLYFEINHYLYLTTKAFKNFMFFLLFINTIMFIVLREFPQFEGKRPIEYAVSSAEMFLLVAHGHHTTDHIIDKINPIMCITIGFIVHLVLLVYVMQLWAQYHSAENKQITVFNSLDAFIRYKALPVEMRKRILLYLDFKYQNHYYKDSSIRQATSPYLLKEILIKISKETTQKVDLLQKVPEKVKEKIRAYLVTVIFLPGDIIIKEGTEGTVKITSDGKEICRLRDGSHFGEIALVANLPRVASVTAVTPCELYKLNQRNFLEVLKKFPEILSDLMSMATQRVAGLENVTTTESFFKGVPKDDNKFEIIGEDTQE